MEFKMLSGSVFQSSVLVLGAFFIFSVPDAHSMPDQRLSEDFASKANGSIPILPIPPTCHSPSSGFILGPVPDVENCHQFYSCVPAPPDSGVDTYPRLIKCPESHNGLLFYDFMECRCDFSSELCYNDTNIRDFFKCTYPLSSTDSNITA